VVARTVLGLLLSHNGGADDELPAMVFAVLKHVLTAGALGTCRVRSGWRCMGDRRGTRAHNLISGHGRGRGGSPLAVPTNACARCMVAIDA
jgi:hypothetical protein